MQLFGVDVDQSTTNSQIKVSATISAVQFVYMLACKWAYGKAGNGSGMENWKRKMEMEIGNGNIKVAGLLAALIDLRVVAGLLFVCIRSSPSLQFT